MYARERQSSFKTYKAKRFKLCQFVHSAEIDTVCLELIFPWMLADRSQRCVGACSVNEGMAVSLPGLYLQHLVTKRGKEIQSMSS